MRYEFQPASHVDDYLKAIAGSNEFVVKRDTVNGLMVLNYVFTCPTSFPDPSTLTGEAHRLAVLRRDCRGLKFDLETGDVVAKPYHKFFNVNEKPETQIGAIDWTQPHIILEKLDGSMITPFTHKDGSFQWHTKMGPTEVAKPLQANMSPYMLASYIRLCWAVQEENSTPIFEWCSRKQRIVVDYPVDQLILTAVRHNVTGEYTRYPKLVELAQYFDVPVVRALPGTVQNAQQFLDQTSDLERTEGFVVRFDSGHMCKVKGRWYLRIHNTKEIFVFEKNVWNLILQDSMDDAKPFMDDKDRALIEKFAGEFEHRICRKAAALAEFVSRAKELLGNDKRRYAIEMASQVSKLERGLSFKIWDGHDPIITIRDFLAKNVSTQNAVDAVRDLVDGLSWRDFYYYSEI